MCVCGPGNPTLWGPKFKFFGPNEENGLEITLNYYFYFFVKINSDFLRFRGQNLQFVQIIIFMESPHNILKPKDCVCATK